MPDPNRHQAFLLEPWQPHKPVLIAFKDPRCPYCLRALKKRHRLSNYNVFLFWAPILGERSRSDVTEIFQCRTPTESSLLERIGQGQRAGCKGEFKTRLAALNEQMVASYQPSYVPQYWFGGRTINFAALKLSSEGSNELAALIAASPVKIPWIRYQEFLVGSKSTRASNLAVVLPEPLQSRARLEQLVARHRAFNWYLFDGNKSQTRESEFRLLNGLMTTTKPTFVLEGHVMTTEQVRRLIEPNIEKVFSL